MRLPKKTRKFAARPTAKRNRTEIAPSIMWQTKELLLLARAFGNTDEVQRAAGYDTKTFASWARGRQAPSLTAFVAIANTIGYEVILVPMSDTSSRPATPEEVEGFDFDATS